MEAATPPQRGLARWAFVGFMLVTLLPVIRRVFHPTILGDDLVRIINLIEDPRNRVAFRPFNEHVAFLFDMVTWATWQVIGHDLRLAPLGYSVASVIPWLLVLGLFGSWLLRETGSRTSSFVAVAIVAQSPLVMEAVWWYSASSFCWAIAGILRGDPGASDIEKKPLSSPMMIGLGAMLGPAGSSLGHLAGPLAVVRASRQSGSERQHKILALIAAARRTPGLSRGLPSRRPAATGAWPERRCSTARPSVGSRVRTLGPGQAAVALCARPSGFVVFDDFASVARLGPGRPSAPRPGRDRCSGGNLAESANRAGGRGNDLLELCDHVCSPCRPGGARKVVRGSTPL